jgi:phage replication initiation protein
VSNNFGASVDFLSLSFQPGKDGFHENLTPTQFATDCLPRFLATFGMSGCLLGTRPSGMFGYEVSCHLLRPAHASPQPIQAGMVAYTPHDTHDASFNPGALLSLSGDGCYGVDFPALMTVLAEFEPTITRVDLAVDYYDGAVSIPDIHRLYEVGAFVSDAGGRQPRIGKIEPRVLEKEGKLAKVGGDTVYIGKRGNCKFLRAYEKAFQLEHLGVTENPYARWVRVELEARSAGCDIPHDVVFDHDAFLLGAYPNFFSQLPYPSHIQVGDVTNSRSKPAFHRPVAQVGIDHLLLHARTSYGPLFNVLHRHLEQSPEHILAQVLPADESKIPKRLILPS